MKAIRIAIRIAATVFVLAIVSGLYIRGMSPASRWVLVMGAEAEEFSVALWSHDEVGIRRMNNDFAYCVVTANPKNKTAVFSPHDDGHSLAVVFAPSESANTIRYEQQPAKRIRGHWYELE